MPFVCHSYVLVCHSYIIRVSLVCHQQVTRTYSYVISMWLVCTRISSLCHSYVIVCHSYVLVCQLYVTRMYSYVIHMSLVCDFTMTLLTHCFGYSSSLEVKELTSHCKIQGDNIETVGEITVLVKFSTKGEKILGSMIEMLRGYKKMKLLAITRGP